MATINHQYEDPKLPVSWNADEKKFYVRLMDILDDIYSRYGRLTEKDLSKKLQDTIKGKADGNDLIELTTRVEQDERHIALKADQTELDTLGNTVSAHSSELTVQADQIQSKASQSSVDSLSGRMSSAETTITQQAGQIQSKASRSSVDSLGNRVTTAESLISQTPEKISAAVYAMQLGAPNLLLGSDKTANITHVWTNYSGSTVSEFEYGGDYPDMWDRVFAANAIPTGYAIDAHIQPTLEVGKTYTVSIEIQCEGGSVLIGTDYENSSWSLGSWVSKRISATFTARNTSDWLWVRADGSLGYFDIRKWKVEEGTEATAWGLNPYELNAGAVEINKDGIRMSGGEIEMNAGSAFRVNSGGSVQINASSADDSFISLGEGNFSASKSGGVSATDGHFSSLDVKGARVLTVNDLPKKILVAGSQPSGHDFIWLRPSSVSSVSYSAFTASSRDASVDFSRTNPITRSFTAATGDTLPNGTHTITLIVPLYSTSVDYTGVTLSAVLTRSGLSARGTFPTVGSIRVKPWEVTPVTLTLTTTTNFFGTTSGTISIALTLTKSQSGSLYIQKETNLQLTASISGGGSAQACTVYYVP